jgi:hypothetical protein
MIPLYEAQLMWLWIRCALLALAAVLIAVVANATPHPPTTPDTSSKPPVIVIGFVGGFVKHDNALHTGVQLAAQLRRDYPEGVHVEVFENHRGEQARAKILQLLDSDRDGSLSLEEKQNARIILYGHSWGGSETVTLARELEQDGVPVLLTIQVDSVTRMGQNDSVIPANVAQAVNYFQADGLVHGVAQIRAVDPKRTQILGNFRYQYKSNPVACDGYPWYARLFEKPHIEIECDPAVWMRMDSLIRSKLPLPINKASASDATSSAPTL